MLTLTNNLSAMNSNRQLGIVTTNDNKLMERLSSGYKINRAADDASGLTISEKMRHQIRGLHQAAENIMDGISYVQTAEGALNEVSDILQRINELSVKSANGTNTAADREAIDREVQSLKSEMQRIFVSTTFNERQIWPDQPPYFKQIGTYSVPVVTFNNTQNSFDITNANYDVLACDSYTIHADENGVNVSWMGYDGNQYETTPIDWETLKKNNYTFEMGDHFGDNDGSNKLLDADGKPVFTHTISFTPAPGAKLEDIIQCIDKVTFSQEPEAYIYGAFENANGNAVSNPLSVSGSLYYPAAVASRTNGTNTPHTFDGKDDEWISPSKSSTANEAVTSSDGNLISRPPNAATVEEAKNTSEGWTFSFYIDGIGMVQAKSTSVSYWAGRESAPDDEGIWWSWDKDQYDQPRKYAITHGFSGGTLSNVMNTLMGAKDSDHPGLLTASETGGTIALNFSLYADNDYTYADNRTSKRVGIFSLSLEVEPTDDEDRILEKIQEALVDQTIIDFTSLSADSDMSTIGNASPWPNHNIDLPIYEGIQYFDVHVGTAADQYIGIEYDSLRLHLLGMEDTNVLTIESSKSAINEVQSAMAIINGQRSDFGAYQNRLEHTYNIDKISEENTQQAESLIRDTDMAKTMVEHSIASILQQAGISMMAQANKNPESVLQLIQ
ncbi:MAG: hypothetical protein HDQ98_16350 [Lachnospiraceae bacterium]|nr:hypothetical protein [Lachnospiraceae bacterium]